jgi:hypothetical protein
MRLDVLQAKVRGYQRRLRDNGLSTDLEGSDDGTDDPLPDGEPSDADDVTGRLVVSGRSRGPMSHEAFV